MKNLITSLAIISLLITLTSCNTTEQAPAKESHKEQRVKREVELI